MYVKTGRPEGRADTTTVHTGTVVEWHTYFAIMLPGSATDSVC